MNNLGLNKEEDKFGNISLANAKNTTIIWDTIYIKNKTNNDLNIEIWSTEEAKFSWTKNIVVYWANAYIKWNLVSTNKNTDLLSIIVIEDPKTGKWWNIYIDPDVTRLESILYADKSIHSYKKGTWILTPNNWWTYDLLKNQLHIYGSIFSNNIIWGSIDKDLICPYYVSKTDCTLDEAQKYDLYNLRRWYENILENSWNPEEGYNKNNVILKSGYTEEDKYPVIIEYNPLILQKTQQFLKTN